MRFSAGRASAIALMMQLWLSASLMHRGLVGDELRQHAHDGRIGRAEQHARLAPVKRREPPLERDVRRPRAADEAHRARPGAVAAHRLLLGGDARGRRTTARDSCWSSCAGTAAGPRPRSGSAAPCRWRRQYPSVTASAPLSRPDVRSSSSARFEDWRQPVGRHGRSPLSAARGGELVLEPRQHVGGHGLQIEARRQAPIGVGGAVVERARPAIGDGLTHRVDLDSRRRNPECACGSRRRARPA